MLTVLHVPIIGNTFPIGCLDGGRTQPLKKHAAAVANTADSPESSVRSLLVATRAIAAAAAADSNTAAEDTLVAADMDCTPAMAEASRRRTDTAVDTDSPSCY